MKFFKKAMSVCLSFLTLTSLIAPNIKAEGEPYSINVLVVETPNTNALKLIKRFCDQNSPLFERDENGNPTNMILCKKWDSCDNYPQYTPVEDWNNYASEFYTFNPSEGTYTVRERRNDLGLISDVTITFKPVHIQAATDLQNSGIKSWIKKSSAIIEMFDSSNAENTFNVEYVKDVISTMRRIDPRHHDSPIFDNYQGKSLSEAQNFFIEHDDIVSYTIHGAQNQNCFNGDDYNWVGVYAVHNMLCGPFVADRGEIYKCDSMNYYLYGTFEEPEKKQESTPWYEPYVKPFKEICKKFFG